MQKSENSVSKETPKTRTPKTGQKKKSSQKPLQKWFKGSPKSRSSQKAKKLLKSPPVEKTPQKPPTPPGVVDFDFDGSFDRVSVFDALPCTETDENIQPDSHVWDAAGLGTDSVDNSCGSAKETPKSRTVPHKKDSHKKNKLPVNRNLNKSLSDADARKKSPPVCKLPEACFDKIQDYKISEAPSLPIGYIRYMEVPQEELADEVEYDLDGEDFAWLSMVNEKRKHQNLQPVKFADMELLMDRLEKESYFQMQSTGIDQGALIDDDAVCCICMDGECQNSNAILFCDMCNLAVHQECYGVPYIPEGQWLCRRCLQSPSRAVDCALCPNKGGAFKQTDDGRWAHVVCAIWIPEVCFANTVFLEPVDSIGNIPPARWRLVCFICKQKGVGACIQCHKSNCYVAFHVTCAQQAGLCMKMDTVRESSSITVKKTAYCDNHAPPDSDFVKDGDGTPSPRQKMRQARKLLAEKRSAVPVLSIPTIPDDRVAEIAQTVAFARKSQFIKRLMAYWKLKRQSRNGVPLLRRLQAASTIPHPPTRDGVGATGASRSEESQTYYRYWLRLRQDLERARLLCELVRKREKVKKELIHLKSREMDIRLRPFCMFLINVLEEIQAWDTQDIFAQPVDVNEVPDYLTIVTHPMDLETMREKINSFEYNNIDEFEADFSLMIENCLNYNSKDTIFYRAGVKLREQGGIIIRHARRSIDAIGFDTSTGLHLPERKHIPIILTDDEILQKVDNALSDDARFDLPFDKHLEMLNEILDDTLALTHPTVRKKKFNKVKHEIVRVRRLKHSKLNRLSSTSPLKQKYKRRESVLADSETEDLEEDVAGTEIKTKQRSNNKSLRPSSEGLGSPESGGRRELRLSKRKREPSPPPAASPAERSPSPPVLRGSKITGREKARAEKVKAPTPKKTRRASSSGESGSTPSSTPNKSKKFNSISEEGTQNDDGDDDTKNPRASPPALPSTPSKGGAGARLLRDREPSTDKVQVLSSSSSSSPVKTPSKSSGVNRRNTVLLTKKINATQQQQQQQQQQQETPNSSPNKTAVTPGKTPKKGSPKKSLPNNVNAASSNNNNNRNKKNPPTRNSARLRNFTNNNSVTINNNNVISNSVSWPHDGFHNNDSSSVNFNNNTTTTTRTTDGLSPSGTPPWNNNSVSESVVVAFDKDHHHHHHLNRHHRNNSSDLPLNSSSSSPSKRKKKVNSPLSSAYKVGAGDVTSLRNSSSNTSGSDILNNGLSGFSSARVPGLNSTRSSHVKSDSFSVYRSGKDLELNSEDEEEDEEKDEDEDKEEDDDDEGPENSDNASSDNDESVDGSHDDSGDESSSSNSKKSSSSSSSSSDSESDSSYQSSSTTRRGKYDMRRKRNENSVNHSRRSENNSRVLNDIHQSEDDEEVEDEEDEEEEEGLITERSHGRVSNNKYRPQPLDLVWAKTKDFSWYPATIINPDTPLEASQNDVQIPVPPSEILSKRPRNSSENNFLVLCFDAKRTWEWISRNHLEPLGLDPKTDQEHLMTRKVDKRTLGALRKAYEKALLHRNRLNGTDGRIHGFPA